MNINRTLRYFDNQTIYCFVSSTKWYIAKVWCFLLGLESKVLGIKRKIRENSSIFIWHATVNPNWAVRCINLTVNEIYLLTTLKLNLTFTSEGYTNTEVCPVVLINFTTTCTIYTFPRRTTNMRIRYHMVKLNGMIMQEVLAPEKS